MKCLFCQNLLYSIPIPCLYLNIWETAAVSLKSSFGTKEECFPPSTRSITPMWRSWSGLKGKWNWHHFLFSFLPIKRWIQQHCTWPEFSHIPLRGTPLLRTHFRPLSGGCACLSLDEGDRVCVEAADGINRGWTLRRHESCDWTFVDAARSLSRWVVELRTPIITCWY